MGHSNGIITVPISIEDVRQTLGDASYDLGTLCLSNNVNRYSFIKPVEEDTPADIQFTNERYINSLIPVKYIAGDSAPPSYIYYYRKPYSWYRLDDFIGYIHNEYPVRGSLADIPDTVDFETGAIARYFYYDTTKRPLLSLLLGANGGFWKARIIWIININGQYRTFAFGSSYYYEHRVGFYPLIYKDLYYLLRNAGNETFEVDAFVVGLPPSHTLFDKDEFMEVPIGVCFTCYPASLVCTPNKTFTLNRPKKRCWLTLDIVDAGNGEERYVPENTPIRFLLTYNDENVFVDGNYLFGTGEKLIEEDSRINESTNYVSGSVEIPDVQFNYQPGWYSPEIGHNADREVYDEGLHTTYLYWDRKVAGDEFKMEVGFNYLDPNYKYDE